MTTRLVTDSNAMLPPELVARFEILVVPLTVVVDGQAIREDEIELPAFYEQLRRGAAVTTSAPAPGEIQAVYEAAVAAGADSILSVHVGSNHSATVSAARLAAQGLDAPVTLVDTGTASFIEGCCVWRAAEHLAQGSDIDTAATAARQLATEVASVFTIGELARAEGSGRLAVSAGAGVPVFVSSGADMRELGHVATIGAAIELMTSIIGDPPGPLRIGIGHADAGDAADELAKALERLDEVADTVRYTVGPSVAAHTGAGTFGAVYHRI